MGFFSSLNNMIGFKFKTVGFTFFLHYTSLVGKMVEDVLCLTDTTITNVMQ